MDLLASPSRTLNKRFMRILSSKDTLKCTRLRKFSIKSGHFAGSPLNLLSSIDGKSLNSRSFFMREFRFVSNFSILSLVSTQSTRSSINLSMAFLWNGIKFKFLKSTSHCQIFLESIPFKSKRFVVKKCLSF